MCFCCSGSSPGGTRGRSGVPSATAECSHSYTAVRVVTLHAASTGWGRLQRRSELHLLLKCDQLHLLLKCDQLHLLLKCDQQIVFSNRSFLLGCDMRGASRIACEPHQQQNSIALHVFADEVLADCST
jgi:hypothetical protein